jgi:hypothetical protein
MNKSIYITLFILSFYLQSIRASDHFFQISTSEKNLTVHVWVDDYIIIVAKDILVGKWFFNNSLLAEYNSSWISTNSSISLLLNATASEQGDDSWLTLGSVNRFHTGIYLGEETPNNYSVDMTVHGNNFCKFKYNSL